MDIPTAIAPNILFIAFAVFNDLFDAARTVIDSHLSSIDINGFFIQSNITLHPPNRAIIELPNERRYVLSHLVLNQRHQSVRLLLEYGADVRYLVTSDYITICTLFTDLSEEEAMTTGFRHSMHPPILKLMEDVGDYLPVIGKDIVEPEEVEEEEEEEGEGEHQDDHEGNGDGDDLTEEQEQAMAIDNEDLTL